MTTLEKHWADLADDELVASLEDLSGAYYVSEDRLYHLPAGRLIQTHLALKRAAEVIKEQARVIDRLGRSHDTVES